VRPNLHNTGASGGLFDFRAEYPGKALIIISYFALQQAMAKWQFIAHDETLAHETGGVEH
jgi:hypothetical protein